MELESYYDGVAGRAVPVTSAAPIIAAAIRSWRA